MTSPADDVRSTPAPREDPPSSAIVLSGVGGGVDGLGYVLLDNLFTAHITGNTVKTGIEIAFMDLPRAFMNAFPIIVFVFGAFAGALLRTLLSRRFDRPRAAVLSMSAILLVGFLLTGSALMGGRAPSPGSAGFYLLATLATLSMGVQNAAKPMFAGRPVRTFMTGTMTDFAEALAASTAAHGPTRRAHLHNASLLGAVWVAYLVGGALVGAAAIHYGTVAAVLPACGVVASLAIELRSR
jgi:uncharacterized membrane protein YoaK (UPF0700 family)